MSTIKNQLKLQLFVNRSYVLEADKRYILASYHKRVFAFLIDISFLCLIVFVLYHILRINGKTIKSINYEGLSHVSVKGDNLSLESLKYIKIGFALLPTFYFSAITFFTNGYTLGKWLCSIRIHSLYHHRISLWHCIERSLGYIASSLEFGLGFLQIIWNPNRMTLHDRIAETVVVNTQRNNKSSNSK